MAKINKILWIIIVWLINLQDLAGEKPTRKLGRITFRVLGSILSEVGLDFSKFPTSKQFTSWLRLAPNNKITGGKIFSSRTPKGKHRLADALRHVAVVIGYNVKLGALHQFFQRILFKKGKQAAIAATARKLAVIIWNMMTKKVQYISIKEEDYLMKIREKQIKSIKRKITSLKIQPNELVIL